MKKIKEVRNTDDGIDRLGRFYEEGDTALFVRVQRSIYFGTPRIIRELAFLEKVANGRYVNSRRDGRPAHIFNDSYNNSIIIERVVNGKTHSIDYPARIEINTRTKEKHEFWALDDSRDTSVDMSWFNSNRGVHPEDVGLIKQIKEDPMLAVKYLSHPLLKYPASACLGNEILPEIQYGYQMIDFTFSLEELFSLYA